MTLKALLMTLLMIVLKGTVDDDIKGTADDDIGGTVDDDIKGTVDDDMKNTVAPTSYIHETHTCNSMNRLCCATTVVG